MNPWKNMPPESRLKVFRALAKQMEPTPGPRGATTEDLVCAAMYHLIAWVEELREKWKGEHANQDAAYERGRADERAAVVAWLRDSDSEVDISASHRIERGEHVP
jgi:hypothetical protein